MKENWPLFIVGSIVNAQERKALKRALESKEKWKAKAQERKKQIRLLELRIRDLEYSRKQWKEKCFKAKKESKAEKTESRSKVPKRQAKTDRKKIDQTCRIFGFQMCGFLSLCTEDT